MPKLVRYKGSVYAQVESGLPDSVDKAFYDMGMDQRVAPEHAMLKINMFHSGVLSPLVEHIGDITNRMTAAHPRYQAGYPYVLEKVKSCLRGLLHPYGFEKEHQENIENNAKHKKISLEKYKAKLDGFLKNYTLEHSKLPVYNEAQWFAREAAISLGKQNWSSAIRCLKALDKHLNDSKEWVAYAHQYSLDKDGNPKLYQ